MLPRLVEGITHFSLQSHFVTPETFSDVDDSLHELPNVSTLISLLHLSILIIHSLKLNPLILNTEHSGV